MVESVRLFATNIQQWNSEIFGNIFKRKKSLLARINGIQRNRRYGHNSSLDRLELQLQKEYTETLKQEDVFWYQKSRSKWIMDGDRNTKYYHSKTVIRRRRNKIITLRDGNGNWLENQEQLRDFVGNFYRELFIEERDNRDFTDSGASFPCLDDDIRERLNLNFSREEIDRAIFEMGPVTAPGEDGLPACFYQQNWEIIGDKVLEFCRTVWENPETIKTVNNTLLLLIPKVTKPKFISQFRPIALCNVVYKIITKAIANWLKPLMNFLVSPFQTSFVPKRNIQHNIILAQEMIHSMHRMRGKKTYGDQN